MDGQLSLTSLIVTPLKKPRLKPKPKVVDEKIYSVSEFMDEINTIFKPLNYTVQGEINQVTERGGAVYFSIRDTEANAVLGCIVWRSKLSSFGITLKVGLEVKIVGAPNLYKPNGRFSFMANYITPVGEGALQQAFEKLKKTLEAEGFFNTTRKRPAPEYVKALGLITSESADAKKDFLTHLGQFGIKVYFYDVRVEGVKSVDSIVEALRWFNENTRDVEVIVLTRGGGSLESLQAFNSEPVAKAIYSSKIPVISAIGHENDVTIADLVADIRASTPTHAGKILSENWNRAQIMVDEVEQSIYSVFRNQCVNLKNNIDFMQSTILSNYKKVLELEMNKVNSIDRSLSVFFQDMLKNFRYITERFTYNFSQFNNVYMRSIHQLENNIVDIDSNATRWFKFLDKYISGQEKDLSLSDPELKLKQGYSITFNKDRKVIKSTDMVAIADSVTIKLHSGEIIAKVDTVK